MYRPENMEIMRNYIIDVSGKQAERYTDDQVHEMFLTRMRDFETSDVGIWMKVITLQKLMISNVLMHVKLICYMIICLVCLHQDQH